MPEVSMPASVPTDAQRIAPTDPRLGWRGAVSLQTSGHPGHETAMPWRLPYLERELFAEPLVERAAMPAGVRIALHTDSTTIAGGFHPDDELTTIDLQVDGRVIASQPLAGRSSFCFDTLPSGEKEIELWLPQYGRFVLSDLWLDARASVGPTRQSRPNWIAYGSSITQCHEAASSSQTWPAIVARELGFDLTCLGYGGQCHLDASVARFIRELPADYISICAGINVYGGATLNERTFTPALIGFVQILREKHLDVPIVIMSPIYSPARETTPNAVGFTLQAMRRQVRSAVDALTAAGDEHLHYVDGLDIFGPDGADHLPDDLHPDAEGYRIMARTYLERAAGPYFG